MISSSLFTSLHIKHSAILLITLLTITACSEGGVKQAVSSKSYHQSAALMTISPEQSYTIERDYLGQITAKQNTSLSFEFAGKVSEIFVDSGDVVKKGQRLAQQDTQLLSYKTAELQAKIAQSNAQITLNKANLDRIKTLINDGYSSKQRLDELNAENQILTAQIEGLNAQINTLAYQNEKSTLVAPFNGVITKRLISNGEVTSATIPSFHIIASANNEINVGIPSKVASTLTLGQLIKIKVDNQIKQAELIAIGHQIDAVNRTVQLRLKMIEELAITNNFNGQLIRISIAQQINKPGFWLPINALTDGVRGQWQIFIASKTTDSKDNYTLQTATVNVLHSNEHSVYVNGLEIKQHQIIALGVHRYVAGQMIKASSQTLASTVGKR